MSEKIKPCPFCGGKGGATNHPRSHFDKDTYEHIGTEVVCNVDCIDCGASTASGDAGSATREEAIAIWNHRPREERLVKLLREAKESLVTLQLISTHAPACRYRATLLAAIDAALKEET